MICFAKKKCFQIFLLTQFGGWAVMHDRFGVRICFWKLFENGVEIELALNAWLSHNVRSASDCSSVNESIESSDAAIGSANIVESTSLVASFKCSRRGRRKNWLIHLIYFGNENLKCWIWSC